MLYIIPCNLNMYRTLYIGCAVVVLMRFTIVTFVAFLIIRDIREIC